MAEKLSTIVIKVDLNCCKCYNKIRKVLCKFHCKIRSKTFDKKANVVIVTGVFDPECFSKCLMCKAGKVITGIDIVKPVKVPEPEPPAPKPEPPPPEPKPEPPPPEPEPVAVVVPEPEPEPKKEPEPEPKKEPEPVCVVPEPKYREPCYPVPGYPPPCWEWYGRPPPCYGGYGMPSPPCHCGCGGARHCVLVCEYDENPTNSCIIM